MNHITTFASVSQTDKTTRKAVTTNPNVWNVVSACEKEKINRVGSSQSEDDGDATGNGNSSCEADRLFCSGSRESVSTANVIVCSLSGEGPTVSQRYIESNCQRVTNVRGTKRGQTVSRNGKKLKF